MRPDWSAYTIILETLCVDLIGPYNLKAKISLAVIDCNRLTIMDPNITGSKLSSQLVT